MEINKTTLSIAAGVAGTLFLGYCIYFDKKRRSDPDYKKKIRESKLQLKSVFNLIFVFETSFVSDGTFRWTNILF